MAILNWGELTTADFDVLDKERTVVILPIGAMEQHGPHLPVSTDTLLVQAVVAGMRRQLSGVDVLFLPPLWCAKSNEHKGFPGTVILGKETLSRVIRDISISVASSGFKRLVYLNAHGGNSDVLLGAIRDIHQDLGLLTFELGLPRLYIRVPMQSGSPDDFDMHAGRLETSLVLASNPELVKSGDFSGLGSDMARGRLAASYRGFQHLRPEGGAVLTGWVTSDYSEDGVIGAPTGANAEEGQQNLAWLVQTVCDHLKEIARFEYKE